MNKALTGEYWQSDRSEIMLNPAMPLEERTRLMQNFTQDTGLQGHVWIATSGSSGVVKWVALGKKALLSSAAAVNRHLKASSKDIWLNALPLFHVGGLSIYARSFLSGSKVVSLEGMRWDAQLFIDYLISHHITLTSLVPAQVFDLVLHNQSPPSCLRAVVVGGGFLTHSLYFKAIELGWPLLPSYGLTECASQVATASLDSLHTKKFPRLIPLDHVELKAVSGCLSIKSPALLTTYLVDGQMIDPKDNGWFQTEDMVNEQDLDRRALSEVKRNIHFVKVGGESVDCVRLDEILQKAALSLKINADAAIFAYPHERLGHVIHLAVAGEETSIGGQIKELVDQFAKEVLPFEKIRQVHFIKEIPRESIKVNRKRVLEIVLEGRHGV